jgi:hypothetical protein
MPGSTRYPSARSHCWIPYQQNALYGMTGALFALVSSQPRNSALNLSLATGQQRFESLAPKLNGTAVISATYVDTRL